MVLASLTSSKHCESLLLWGIGGLGDRTSRFRIQLCHLLPSDRKITLRESPGLPSASMVGYPSPKISTLAMGLGQSQILLVC